jgi:hypothetical protein
MCIIMILVGRHRPIYSIYTVLFLVALMHLYGLSNAKGFYIFVTTHDLIYCKQ